MVELKFFTDFTTTHTCEDCFGIELGSSPYQYLYGLTRMRQVNICKKMQMCVPHISVRYILLRLDECWIQGEDTLKCNTFFEKSKLSLSILLTQHFASSSKFCVIMHTFMYFGICKERTSFVLVSQQVSMS